MKSTSILITVVSMMTLTMASPSRIDVDSSIARRSTGNGTTTPKAPTLDPVAREALIKRGCLPRQTLTFVGSEPQCTDCGSFVQTCQQAPGTTTRNTVALGCVQDAKISLNSYNIHCTPCAGDSGSLSNNRDTECTACLPGASTCVVGDEARDLTCHSNRYLFKNATTGFSRCTDCGNGTTTAYKNSASKCQACPFGATSCNSNLSPVNSTACAIPYFLSVKINAVGIGYGKCIPVPLLEVVPNVLAQ